MGQDVVLRNHFCVKQVLFKKKGTRKTRMNMEKIKCNTRKEHDIYVKTYLLKLMWELFECGTHDETIRKVEKLGKTENKGEEKD